MSAPGWGIMAVPLLSLYVASKHAVEGLSESLSYELESQNIRIKLVEPGAMRTTNFTASGMAASQEAPVPESYKAYFDHALRSMIELSLCVDRRAGGGRDDLPRRDRSLIAPALSRRAGCGGICPAALVDLGRRISRRDEPADGAEGVARADQVIPRAGADVGGYPPSPSNRIVDR